METALQNGENCVTQQQLETLETMLNAVLAELTPLAGDPEPAEPASEPPDEAAIHKLLAQLEPLLEDSDSACLEYTGKLRAIPGAGKLIGQIENFDFRPALESLIEIKKAIRGTFK